MLNTKLIGNKIAEARKKINISQAQLAQQLFISSQAVGKWERGESMPDITTFNRLAEILNVDLNYFSENFQSKVNEITLNEPLNKQSEKEEKKLSWDMSYGNWVDADFSGLKDLHEKFSSSNMLRCFFVGSEMSELLLKNNNVDSCDFSNSNISNSNIQNSNLANNIFKSCSLKETKFLKNYIKGCDFSGANLIEVDLIKSNHIDSCNFSNTDISNSHIQKSSLANNIFKNSSLKKAEFLESHIKGCDFSDTNFTQAEFKSGAFVNNTVINAVWSHTSFIGMQIDDILFDGTLEDCYFENCSFNRVIFQNSTLINTFFKNNNLKRIQFIDCQADRMTYEFLKSGKADLTGINLQS
ncbi:pentapeptide repeat-containing protein [Flavobacterium sp. PL02]|uniref:pentapeptide repeat-containing protein n=1 Tax=Flavobacterium sp. PL02 TaxID=3088354 RepID=UPI002B22C464|nr:pentapeptide repeat-containing protein [Flavobacterium sp. PL02]MEA9414059.1 pentapeptide repeat-containing protein [Flavobacterium sp. PL02]